MPNNLSLAVEIADVSAAHPVVSMDEAYAKAKDIAARHPDSDASVGDVAEALQASSINELDQSSPEPGQPDLTSDGDA